jgi:hypothetical protein
VAARPPLRNQNTVPDAQAAEDCGQTVAAMLLEAGGKTDTPLEEISDLGHDGVTSVQELTGLLTGAGATVAPVPAVMFSDALATGDAYALVLIHDNGNADPDPAGAFTHWIAGYAINSDGSVQCVNPWGGRDIAYPRSLLVSATIWAAVVRFPPAPHHIEEADRMVIVQEPNGSQNLLSGAAYIHIDNPVDLASLAAAVPGIGTWKPSNTTVNAIRAATNK